MPNTMNQRTMDKISPIEQFKQFLRKIRDNAVPSIRYGRYFYSQGGEDMLLSFYYDAKKYKGFFVDVGAHHPYRFSNTAYFYKRGWRGINIEPTPSLFKAFPRYRKRDINLNVGIGNGEALTFYVFNEGALNTFDPALAQERNDTYNGNSHYEIIDRIQVQTYPLRDILDKYLPEGVNIDLLTIDVEGMDFEVLKSNDWTKYIPRFILVECESSPEHLADDQIYAFLREKNYTIVGRTMLTTLFKLNTE